MATTERSFVGPAGTHGSTSSSATQPSGRKSQRDWDKSRRADGSYKRPWYKEHFCPLVKEYCKGPKCMAWDAPAEACVLIRGLDALHFVATQGKHRDTGALVEALADKMRFKA